MKYFSIIPFIFFLGSVNGQVADTTFLNRSNELRVNPLNLLLGSVDVQYERLLNHNSGLVTTIGIGFNAKESPVNTLFKLTPAYRHYFGVRKAAGFFVEAESRLSYDKGEPGREEYVYGSYYKNEFNVGLAASAGGKLATRNGFSGVIKGGIGRFLTNKNSYFSELYPVFEVSLGKRF